MGFPEVIKDSMKVVRDMGGDYYIYVSKEMADKIRFRVNRRIPSKYNWLEANVSSELEGIDETLGLTCSNDSRIASAPGKITFNREEDDEHPQNINVRVFPTELDKLVNEEVEYLMTRYDRVENKVWIFLDKD